MKNDLQAVAPVLTVKGLKAAYGRIEVLHGIDIEIGVGQLVSLIGTNGAGKTTLLKTLAGVMRGSAGSIALFGQDVTTASPDRRVRAGLSLVPEGRQVFAPLSIEDNLRLGAYTRKDGDRASDIERMYALFPVLKEKRRLPAGNLSGGQQQMLAIARALMARPKVLLLDEPSMGLAPMLVAEIFEVVARLKGEGIPILLVEQNAQVALSVADHAYVLQTGSISMQGSGQALLADDRVQEAYLGM